VNSTGESANSNQASATPVAPSGVTISVTSYGATGNGVADDTAPINSAISALQAGYTLSFPCGTYLVSSALKPIAMSNVSIVGASGCTTIKATGSGYKVMQVGTGGVSSQTALSSSSAELSTNFSAAFGNIGGLAAGDYVILQEGGMDYSTDTAPGHNTNCDVSGCRGEVLQVASVSGSTATVSTALHYTYDPFNNAANVKKLTAPVSNVTVSNLVFDGSGTVSNGLYMNGVVNSTVSNVTAKHFVDWGLLSYWSYNLAWNGVAVQSSGNGNSDAFQLWGQGKASINGLTISNLNSNAFGMGLSTVADSTFTNVTIDGTGTTSGRPLKLLATSYSTFNSTTVKNGGAGGYNGISLEYYSSHNTFNSCSVTNNSGTGILGFGNYDQYNKFVNCTVNGNTGWQLGQGASALGTYMDGYWEISGGAYTGASSNAVLQLDGFNNYIHNVSINGPGEPGIYAYGNNNCINSNTFGGTFSPYAIYFGGSGNIANGNSTGSGLIYPNPLPSGTCP
jgi:hypothetical protein